MLTHSDVHRLLELNPHLDRARQYLFLLVYADYTNYILETTLHQSWKWMAARRITMFCKEVHLLHHHDTKTKPRMDRNDFWNGTFGL